MKMRSRKVLVSLLLVALAIITMVGVSQGAEKTYVMRIAHSMPTTHGYHNWATKFEEELSKRIGDRVKVQIFPNAQLGTETEYLQQLSMGTLQASILGRHSQIDPRLDVLNLPFIFRDTEHKDIVLRQGREIQNKLDNILLEHGYVNLGWGELGFRYITTKDTPVYSAKDLVGLDIRVPNVPSWLTAFKAWGANPTPLDFSEVYSALQQGVVDAQENPSEIIYSSNFYEVQKYLSMTQHASIPCQFLVSESFWNTLPDDIKTALKEAAKISRDYQVQKTREANQNLIGSLEKEGMILIKDVDKESFKAGAEKAYEEYISKYGDELINDIKNAK